jgi:type II secretory pathway component GspD/PulD (secretin)
MFFLTVSVVMAQIKLEVIPLNNRQAQDLLPIIRPLLDLNETVSGMGYQLIVQASPRKLREIKSLLKTIDTQRINLRITVKQGTRSQLNKLELEIGAEIPIGKTGRVIINSGRDNSKGVVVVGEKGRGEIREKLLQSKSSLKEMNTQIITTLEGNSATIYFT